MILQRPWLQHDKLYNFRLSITSYAFSATLFIPDYLKTQEMCEKSLKKIHVPDHFKTQEMCDKTVRDDPFSLVCVPDWFVTQQQIKLWHDDQGDDDDDDDDDKFFRRYESYQKCKA